MIDKDALVASLSAWAIEQDGDGYYLIGSAADWDEFAAVVAEMPSANAKMTDDVNLGDDQTMIGHTQAEVSRWLSGTHNFTLATLAKISVTLEVNILTI